MASMTLTVAPSVAFEGHESSSRPTSGHRLDNVRTVRIDLVVVPAHLQLCSRNCVPRCRLCVVMTVRSTSPFAGIAIAASESRSAMFASVMVNRSLAIMAGSFATQNQGGVS